MNLYAKLQARAAQQKPICVALIGAGKFGSMFLAQAVQTPGMHITGIADLCLQSEFRPPSTGLAGSQNGLRPPLWRKLSVKDRHISVRMQ